MYLLFTYYSNNRVESSNNELSSCWYALQMASLNFDDVSRGTDKKSRSTPHGATPVSNSVARWGEALFTQKL